MLTRESVLFYWSALHGVRAAVGGDPVYSRDSAATFRGFGENERTLIRNLPRFTLKDLLDDAGVRPVLQLEPARTNKCWRNHNHGGAITDWALINAPNGLATLSAVLDKAELAAAGLADLAPDGYVLKLDNSGGDGFAYARASGSTGDFETYQSSAYVRGSGSAGVGLSGASPATQALTAAYTRQVNQVVPATTGDVLQIRAAAGGVCYFILAQLETGVFETSVIPTAGSASVTRAVDQFYFSHAPKPQGLAAYIRFQDLGTRDVSGTRVFGFGENPIFAAPRFFIYNDGADYVVLHHTSAGNVSVGVQLPALGQVVELLAILNADGSVRLIRSYDDDTPAARPTSAAHALASEWNSDRIYLNSNDGGSFGSAAFADLRVVKLADLTAADDVGRMDEMRDLVLDDAGNLI